MRRCARRFPRQEKAKKVLVLERAPEDESGGNSRFTAGLFRIAYNGAEDLKTLIPDLSREEIAQHRLRHLHRGAVPRRHGARHRVPLRSGPDRDPRQAAACRPWHWMRSARRALHRRVGPAGVQDRRQVQVLGRPHGRGGRRRAGPGRIADADREEGRHRDLVRRARRVAGCRRLGRPRRGRASTRARPKNVEAKAVVLAAGGFQANTEWRTRYIGPGWELAKVRGTRFNTGDAIRMALDIGAAAHGNWSGCHAVAWDRNAPEFGDLAVGDQFQKHSYPWGVYINAEGKRFVDEGADFRNYTYAKYGRVILQQPKQFAWQIFDGKVKQQLRDEYRITAGDQGHGRHARGARARSSTTPTARPRSKELKEYNAAVQTDIPFNPNVKDGRCTQGPGRSTRRNWANTLDTPPFEAYAVTCGITFTLRRPADQHRSAGDQLRRRGRFPASTPPASWWAGSSGSTIPAARASPTARCSGRSPAPVQPRRRQGDNMAAHEPRRGKGHQVRRPFRHGRPQRRRAGHGASRLRLCRPRLQQRHHHARRARPEEAEGHRFHRLPAGHARVPPADPRGPAAGGERARASGPCSSSSRATKTISAARRPTG